VIRDLCTRTSVFPLEIVWSVRGTLQTLAQRTDTILGMTVVVDFIAKGVADDEWLMVLVEEGQWFLTVRGAPPGDSGEALRVH